MVDIDNLTNSSNLPPGVSDGDPYFQEEDDTEYCEICGMNDDECRCSLCEKCGKCEESEKGLIDALAPKMLEMLKTLEWCNEGHEDRSKSYDMCPCCDEPKMAGKHLPHCPLSNLIAQAEGHK